MLAHTFKIDEADRQAIILGLAELSIARPGWVEYLAGIARQMQSEQLFDAFRQNHSNALAAALAGEPQIENQVAPAFIEKVDPT